MNAFELFCMIYFVLDYVWDDTHDEALGQYLSDANPFVWRTEISANPATYTEYLQVIDAPITVENSYDFALSYIDRLNDPAVSKAFSIESKDEWIKDVSFYLSREHKGGLKRTI